MHLIDTDVLLALGAQEPGEGDEPLFEWANSLIPNTVYLSVVSLMDLEGAAAQAERKEKSSSAATRSWLDERVRAAFDGRILPVDDKVVRRWSRFGQCELREGLLAATALEHGLTIATGRPAAYRMGKVKTVHPWTYSPDSELDWRQASHSAPQWLKSLFVRA
jgi:predicted nucleic acid-binding protein